MGYIRDKSFGGFGKSMVAPAPEAPSPSAAGAPTPSTTGGPSSPTDFVPLTEVPDDPADYKQDPRCSEGKIIQSGQTQCTDDPIYIELMEDLQEELADLEAREKTAALRAQAEAQQAQIQAEMEQQRIALDKQRIIQKRQEEKQIKRLTIYGMGALGVIAIITLIIKFVLP